MNEAYIKKCSHCKIEKKLTDFGSNKSRKDRLNTYCKPCVFVKSNHQKQNDNYKDYARKYAKNYTIKNRKMIALKGWLKRQCEKYQTGCRS